MISRRQIQLLADTAIFRSGRLFKSAVLALEYAAGVGEGLVKKELIEVVSQVVMGSDVEATSFFCVAAEEMKKHVERCCDPGQSFFHSLQHLSIQDDDAHHCGQVIGRPLASHESLAGANTASKYYGAVETGIVDGDCGFQGELAAGFAENTTDRAVDYSEFSPAQTTEERKKQFLGKLIKPTWFSLLNSRSLRWHNGVGHDLLSFAWVDIENRALRP